MGFDAFFDDLDDWNQTDNMGGDMEGVIVSLSPTGQPLNIIESTPGGMYPTGIREIERRFPRIIHVRLD